MCDSITNSGQKCSRSSSINFKCLQHSKIETFKKELVNLKTKAVFNKIQEIQFHKLITEFYKIFFENIKNISYLKTFLTFKQNESNLFDIRFSETKKCIGLKGDGFFLFKKITIGFEGSKHISLFPKNFCKIKVKNKRKLMYVSRNPIWNYEHGYMFNKNIKNIKCLNLLISFAYFLNSKNLVLSKNYLDDKNFYTDSKNKDFPQGGIIGVEKFYDEPEWVTKIISGDKLNNPIVKDNIFFF